MTTLLAWARGPALAWAKKNRRLVAGVAAAVLLAGGAAIFARCRPAAPPAPAKVETSSSDRSSSSTAIAAKTTTTKTTRKQARVVRETFRPDGTVSSRTTREEGEVAGEQTAGELTARVDEARAVDTRAATTYQSARDDRFDLRAAATWSSRELALKPDVSASAAVRVVGPVWLRATAIAHRADVKDLEIQAGVELGVRF